MKLAKYVSVWNGRTMEIEYHKVPEGATAPYNRYNDELDNVLVQLVDTTLPQVYQEAADNQMCDFHFAKMMTPAQAAKEITMKLKYPKWMAHAFGIPGYNSFSYKTKTEVAAELPKLVEGLQ